MEKHNPIFGLKNFRSFGEEGADFELAPITVLTGCNSAGKSSLVKALMLMSGKANDGCNNVNFNSELKVSSRELGLGGFNAVAHKDGMMEMTYTIWSPLCREQLVVTRTYCAKHKDMQNNGELYHLTIKKTNGSLVYELGPGSVDGMLTPNGRLYPNESGNNPLLDEYNKYYAVWKYMQRKASYLIAQMNDKDLKRIMAEEGVNERDPRYVEYIDMLQAPTAKTRLDEAQQRLETMGYSVQEAEEIWKETGSPVDFGEIEKRYEIDSNKSDLRTRLIQGEKEYFEAWAENEKSTMFLETVVNEAINPKFVQRIEYVSSTSAQVQRLYTVEDNNKMCIALRELNKKNISFNNLYSVYAGGPAEINKPCKFLNKWLDKFGIGDRIEVKGTDEGLGLMVYLVKGENKRLLADEGYGITQLISLLLQIDNIIPMFVEPDEWETNGHPYTYTYKQHTICVEEPEIHLHPKFQSLLADMFVEAYQKYNIHFIIETHSEYLIRKLQVMVADKNNTLTSNDVSLNYVEKDEHGVSHNKQIKIKEDGRLIGSFGKGFYDEADSLALELMKYKARKK